ncbi:MAG: helix-turn-helix transcriptional regulator [Pyrinomonadaceae bacterium]|nr:helix-turn-helix transcriptional regulator [Pyrinomonadaceae bacterium]
MKIYTPATLGKSLTKFEKNGFVLTETKHKPNLSLCRHGHQRASIACVLEGYYIENIDSRNYECNPHSLLIKPAGEYHSNKYDRVGAHCLILEVEPKRLSDFYSLPDVFRRTRQIQKGKYFAIINRIRQELRISDSATEIAIEGLFLELLGIVARQTRKPFVSGDPYWLNDVIEFIHAYSAQPISLSAVSTAVGFHPSHISRVFRKKYNCSIGTYIRQIRLENAAEQLIDTKKSIAEIAISVGFYDQCHFSNLFKLYTGKTPSKYRSERN